MAISNGVPISVASSVYSKPSFVGSVGSANQTSNKFSKMSMGNNMSARSGLIKSVDQPGGTIGVQNMMSSRRRQYLDGSGIDKKNLPSLPIYQLLRAFNLQQYTLVSAQVTMSKPGFTLFRNLRRKDMERKSTSLRYSPLSREKT